MGGFVKVWVAMPKIELERAAGGAPVAPEETSIPR